MWAPPTCSSLMMTFHFLYRCKLQQNDSIIENIKLFVSLSFYPLDGITAIHRELCDGQSGAAWRCIINNNVIDSLWPSDNVNINSCMYRHRAIITWTNADSPSIGPSGIHFGEKRIDYAYLHLKKMHLKIPSARRRPFCSGLKYRGLIAGREWGRMIPSWWLLHYINGE